MHPAHDNPHVSISPANLKIATAGGSIIVTPVNGTPITLTSDAVDLLANDSMPAGLTEKLNKAEQKEIVEFAKLHVANRSNHGASLYIPGPIHIVEALTGKYRFRTIPELGTDHEKIFYYNGQIYERAETVIKSETHAEYIKQWSEQLKLGMDADNKNHITKMKRLLDRGPSATEITEALQMIRRTTFTDDPMNPETHIPFANGLLNLKNRKLEPFTPEFFFTYQIAARLLDNYVTLKYTPMFSHLLNTVFYEPDVPLVLSYAAYGLRPDFPAHKVLVILGRERIGKGTFVRVLQGIMPKGSGSFSLAKLLTAERFQLSGVEGKNLLIDSEAKRVFRKGTPRDWTVFCNLFGGDVINIEPKGREAHDYKSNAKGTIVGNLPFIPVDSPPAIARILVVETRNDRPKQLIPNFDSQILENERDLIATLLVQVMFRLEDRDFQFPGQLTDEATATVLEQLADPVANFVDERTEFRPGESVSAEEAYNAFNDWCGSKGIPSLNPQTFKKAFGGHYLKKRTGPRNKLEYRYMDCQIFGNESEPIIQDRLQVGNGYNAPKTQKISLSRDRYRRFQHECSTLRVRKKEDHEYIYNRGYVYPSWKRVVSPLECL